MSALDDAIAAHVTRIVGAEYELLEALLGHAIVLQDYDQLERLHSVWQDGTCGPAVASSLESLRPSDGPNCRCVVEPLLEEDA